MTPAERLALLEEIRDAAIATATEQQTRTAVDVFAALDFTPNPGPQTAFLALPDDNIDVLYGGSVGGSKSTSLLLYALRSCVRYPGLQAFWFRRSFPELQKSVLRMLARYGYAKALGATYNEGKYELKFPNNSILAFGHAKNLQEASALQSAEINLLLIDERTTIPPDVVDLLYTRVRSGVAGVPCLGIRSATNPGGIGHSRVRTDYVEATEFGKHPDVTGRRQKVFIQAKLSDTPQLGADYALDLADDIRDPVMLRALVNGDWDVFADQAFSEFNRNRHIVPATLQPSAEWERLVGVDYGWTAPTAVIWLARDRDGRCWAYRELTMRRTPEREQARRILTAERGEASPRRYADPSMWGQSSSALPTASSYALEGCALIKADNNRLVGKARVHTYLAEAPSCVHHAALGWDTCPLLHIIDGTCPELVRTLPALPRDQHNPEDVDTDAEDHHYDSLRYALLGVGTAGGIVFRPDQDAGDTGWLAAAGIDVYTEIPGTGYGRATDPTSPFLPRDPAGPQPGATRQLAD